MLPFQILPSNKTVTWKLQLSKCWSGSEGTFSNNVTHISQTLILSYQAKHINNNIFLAFTTVIIAPDKKVDQVNQVNTFLISP